METRLAYQGHELAKRAFHMQVFNSLHTHHALPRPKGREHDEGTVRLNDLPNFVHPAEQNAVDFGGGNRDILRKQSNAGEEFVDPELGLLNALGRLARDEDLVGVPTLGIRRTIAVTP
jgi:hypothetical protein